MKSLLRRGTLIAVVALVVLPAAANAAFTTGVTVSPVTAGCGPKGVNVIPVTSGGSLPSAAYSYKVEAVLPSGDTPPCEAVSFPALGTNANFLIQWDTTPGATAYKIFRNDQLVKTVAVPSSSATGGCAAAPSDPDTSGVTRCFEVDNLGNTPGSGTPVAIPSAFTAAGGSPDITLAQTYDYDGTANNNADDPTPNGTTANSASLKTNILKFPAGLAANPGATTKVCTLAQLLGDKDLHGSADTAEDKCPRSSQVGSVLARIETANATPATTQPTPTVGSIYIGEKLGNETARLYVVLRPACSAGSIAPLAPGSSACAALPAGTEVEKSFLSAKATIRQDGTFGIDNETTNISDGTDKELEPFSRIDVSSTGGRVPASSGGQVPIQVQSVRQILFGKADQGTAATTDDKGFTFLPTNCDAKTFGVSASSYLNPTAVTTTAPLQATACDQLPFDPKIAVAVDATGQSGQNGHPKLVAAISQVSGEAATKKTVVTLPAGLGTNINALGNACKQTDVATGSCPATSKVGTATATTPLLPGTFTGDVFVAEGTGASAFPNLEVFLKGPADIHLTGTTAFSTDSRLVNTFDNLPEVPLNSFVLTVDGGANGLLNVSQALCKQALGSTDVAFNGHNGKNTTASVTTPTTGVSQDACQSTNPPTYYEDKPVKPKVKVTVKGVKKNRPKLSMSIKRGSAVKVSNPRKSTVKLPKGLKFTSKGKKRTVVKVNGKKVKTFTAKGSKLVITSGSSTKTITVSTKSGALKETKKVRKGGKKKKLTFKSTIKVQKPKTYKVTTKVKPKS